MRDLIQLIEAALVAENDDNGLGEPLEGHGYYNPNLIADALPGIKDRAKFIQAWRKIMKNDEERLTRFEMYALANAFISLVRLPQPEKYSLIRKLSLIHSEAPDAEDDDGGIAPPRY